MEVLKPILIVIVTGPLIGFIFYLVAYLKEIKNKNRNKLNEFTFENGKVARK